MTYILCTILGSIVTALSILFTYQFTDNDPAILIWLGIYTIGLIALVYGVSYIRLYLPKWIGDTLYIQSYL